MATSEIEVVWRKTNDYKGGTVVQHLLYIDGENYIQADVYDKDMNQIGEYAMYWSKLPEDQIKELGWKPHMIFDMATEDFITTQPSGITFIVVDDTHLIYEDVMTRIDYEEVTPLDIMEFVIEHEIL